MSETPPPSRPYTLSEIPLSDALIALAVMALVGAVAGYTLGLGRATNIAERAEAAALSAETTLSEARRLCGAPR